MKIPRVGQQWVIKRGGKGKRQRRVTVVIKAMYRRPPADWSHNVRHQTRWHYDVYYATEGTWAAHGRRCATLRSFLTATVPK